MQSIFVTSGVAGVGVVTVASIIGIIIKRRNHHKKVRKMPRIKEESVPIKRRELYASFKYRDDFRVDHVARSENIAKESFQLMRMKFKPREAQMIVDKYQNNSDTLRQPDTQYDAEDFRCPLSGQIILNDPVTLNGFVYERGALEDWIFQSDWLDPMFIF